MDRAERMAGILSDGGGARYRSGIASGVRGMFRQFKTSVFGPEYESPKVSYVLECGSERTKLTFEAIAKKGFQVGCTTRDPARSSFGRRSKTKQQPSRPLVGTIVTADRFALAYSVAGEARPVHSNMRDLKQREVMLVFNRRDMTGHSLMVNAFKSNMTTCLQYPTNLDLFHRIRDFAKKVELSFLKNNVLCFIVSLQAICQCSLRRLQAAKQPAEALDSMQRTMTNVDRLVTSESEMANLQKVILVCDRLFKVRHRRTTVRNLCVAQDTSILADKIDKKLQGALSGWSGVLAVWAAHEDGRPAKDGVVPNDNDDWTHLIALADSADRIVRSLVRVSLSETSGHAREERDRTRSFEEGLKRKSPSQQDVMQALTEIDGRATEAFAATMTKALRAVYQHMGRDDRNRFENRDWDGVQSAVSQSLLNERGVQVASDEIPAFADIVEAVGLAVTRYQSELATVRTNAKLASDAQACDILGACIPVPTNATMKEMVAKDFSAVPRLEAIRIRASEAFEGRAAELGRASTGFGHYDDMASHMLEYVRSTILAHRTVDEGLRTPAEWQAKYIELVQTYNRQTTVHGVSVGEGRAFLEHAFVWFVDAACGEYIMGGIEVFDSLAQGGDADGRGKGEDAAVHHGGKRSRDGEGTDGQEDHRSKRRRDNEGEGRPTAEPSFQDTQLTLKEYVNSVHGTDTTTFPMRDAYMLYVAFNMNMAGNDMQHTLDAHSSHPIAVLLQMFMADANFEAHRHELGETTKSAMRYLNYVPIVGSAVSDCIVSPSMKLYHFAKTRDAGWFTGTAKDAANCMMRHPLKVLLLTSSMQAIRIFHCCKHYLSDFLDDPVMRAKIVKKIVTSVTQQALGKTYILYQFTAALFNILCCIYSLWRALSDAQGSVSADFDLKTIRKELNKFIQRIRDCITTLLADVMRIGQWAIDFLLNWVKYFMDAFFDAVFGALESVFGPAAAKIKTSLLAMLDSTLGMLLGVSFKELREEDAAALEKSIGLVSGFANEFAFMLISKHVIPRVCGATWFISLPVMFSNMVRRLCAGSLRVVTSASGLTATVAGSGASIYFLPLTAPMVAPLGAGAAGALTIKAVCKFILTPLLNRSDSEDFMTHIDLSSDAARASQKERKLISLISLGIGDRVVRRGVNTAATIMAEAGPNTINRMARSFGLGDVISAHDGSLNICPSVFRALLIVQSCVQGAGADRNNEAMCLFTTIMTIAGMRKTETAALVEKLMDAFADSEVGKVMEPFQFLAFLTVLNTLGQLLYQAVVNIACHISSADGAHCFCQDLQVYADHLRDLIEKEETLQATMRDISTSIVNANQYANRMADAMFSGMERLHAAFQVGNGAVGSVAGAMSDAGEAAATAATDMMEHLGQLQKGMSDIVNLEKWTALHALSATTQGLGSWAGSLPSLSAAVPQSMDTD